MDEHLIRPPPRLSVAALTNKTLPELIRNSISADIEASRHHHNQNRQLQFLQARLLARSLLPPGPWRIEADRNGRPLVVGEDGMPGPDLSITHSGPWVMAATAPWGRIGIDVETSRPGRDPQAIAQAFLSEPERTAVAERGEAALLAFWTMREAIAKLSGGGMAEALALDGASLIAGRDATCHGASGPLPWVLAHRDCGTFQIALAWSAPDLPPDWAASVLSDVLDTLA